MKQLQQIAAFSVIATLTGLPPMVAAESGGEQVRVDQRQSETPLRSKLSLGQMDKVHGGLDGDVHAHYMRILDRQLICAYIGCGPYPIGTRTDEAR
jgi:hypothetical protein